MNIREVLVRLMIMKDKYSQLFSEEEQEALLSAIKLVNNEIASEDDLR